MAHLDPPLTSRVVRDAGDEGPAKIFAAFLVGEQGESTITPLVLKSTERVAQQQELAAQVQQWAKAAVAFIHEHPERLGL